MKMLLFFHRRSINTIASHFKPGFINKRPTLVWYSLILIVCLHWLYLCPASKYSPLNLKGKHASCTFWHSYRLLRGHFLLFTKGFSLRTVGILVLAHPTQNLFAQIFPIILQTIVWQKHFNKMRFCLVTLSYMVTSKVSPAHSMNNKSNKPKSLMILDFHKPSAGCLLTGIVYHPLKMLALMEMCRLNLIMALDNVHFSLLKHWLG